MPDFIDKDVINIAILDKNTLIRKALANLISTINDCSVLIDVASPEELFNSLMENDKINVLLINSLPSASRTISLMELIKTKFPDIGTVLVINRKDPSLIGRLVDTGIYGCIDGTSEPSELIFSLRCAYHKKTYQNMLFTEALYWKTDTKRKHNPEVNISDKHKKLLKMLWEEKSVNEISDEICLCVSSIEKMKQYLKGKLGVKTVIGLIKYAIDNHIVSIDSRSI